MVKRVNLVFEDSDHEQLLQKKGKRSWEQFILTLLEE